MTISPGHIVDALSSLGGIAHYRKIADRVREIAPQPLPKDVEAVVRGRIHERCAEASQYRGVENLFYSVHGISARKGIWGLRSRDALSPKNDDAVYDGADAFLETPEGRATLRIHLRRERSRKLINLFKISLKVCICQVCGFDFEKVYGDFGAGYIEAHHAIPVAKLEEGATTKLSDLVPLCANCHKIIHRNGLISIATLKAHING